MEQLENRYAIKRLLKSSDDGYLEALKIYNESTPIDIKTNTNEITYWIDNYAPTTKFEPFLFVLYLDNKIIGFAMLGYLVNRRVIVYDYIALKDQYRVNTAYFAYISLITNFIYMNGYKVDYFVVEISNKNAGKDVDKESRVFLKLLCLEGFCAINTSYRTLPLGMDNYESGFDASLYIKKSSDSISSVTRETFLNIVKGIYFDYYETWYTPFLKSVEMDSFRQNIDLCFKKIQDSVRENSILNVIINECLVSVSNHERTDGSLPAQKRKLYKLIPAVIIVLLIAPILVVFGYNWILDKLQIPISSVNSMISGIFGATMSFVIAYFLTIKRS
ncbi:MAG: hypothetical protein LBI42_09585 [Chitinispirillales bacterium]|jgi:hypothetical protein|nr:hypothetical protein [Chitinispirillales bacterium]